MSDTVLHLFEDKVKQFPNNVALTIESSSKEFTYAQLDNLASKISCEIISKIREEKRENDGGDDSSSSSLVAIMMGRDVGFIAAILGILKAGLTYVPVDPAFPPNRQSYIFNQSKCKLLITDSEMYESALKLGVSFPPRLLIESDTAELTISSDKENSLAHNKPNDNIIASPLVYVLYTSGSTGNPKGVMVTHEGLINVITWFAKTLQISQRNRILGLTTFCFDISMLEIFLALTQGSTLVLADSKCQKDPFRLLSVMTAFKVDVFQATPTTYEMMMATGWKGDENITFLVGGEAFRSSLLPISNKCRSFWNVYGPTETTIWSTAYKIPKGSTSSIMSIGAPISKTDFYLVVEGTKDSNTLELSRNNTGVSSSLSSLSLSLSLFLR